MICSFFGHRTLEITDELYAIVSAEILRLVDLGCRIFYFGGYGDFDDLCFQIVKKIKENHAEYGIRCVCCVPQERDLRKRERYTQYDEVVYLMPSFDGWYKSVYFRNCAMIDESDVIIFYAEERQNSGAYKAYKYAKTKRKACCQFVGGHLI